MALTSPPAPSLASNRPLIESAGQSAMRSVRSSLALLSALLLALPSAAALRADLLDRLGAEVRPVLYFDS